MSTIGALNSGVVGIQRGLDALDRDANVIARANRDGKAEEDMVEALVHLSEDRNQVAASAKVIKTAAELLGSLVDERA